MSLSILINELEILANAPNGMSLLRTLILDLALSGELNEEKIEFESKLLGDIAVIRTGKLDANASSADGLYPFFTCAKDPLRISTFSYDTECVLLAGNGNFDVNYYSGKFDAYQRTYILEPKNKEELFVPFLFRFMQSHARKLTEQSIGGVIKYLKIGFLTSAPIQVPSFNNQKSIVAVIDTLMSMCDEIELRINRRESIRNSARSSAIDAVATAQTAEDMQAAWERIQRNWEVIAGSSQSIGDLRGLILTFAASGLLVKQDLSEKPPRFESVTSTKEIPKNWIWCELDAIASYGGTGSVNAKSIPKDGWILDLEDIEKSTSRLLLRSFGADRKTTSNKSSFNSGDVLYGKLRPYLDKVLVADMPGFCTTEIVPIRPKDGLDPNWLRICLKRPEFIKKVTELSYGTKMPRLGTNDAKTSVHPIPPLEEQKRIVERVDQLFQICDQLEQNLIIVKNIGDKFARSVVSA
jgi:restriction endonuclease S subunit